MEGSAWSALYTMGGPGSAALLEADVVFRVPVTRRKDRNAAGFRLGNPLIQNRDNGIAFGDGQRSAGTEVILYIHNKERIAKLKTHETILIDLGNSGTDTELLDFKEFGVCPEFPIAVPA